MRGPSQQHNGRDTGSSWPSLPTDLKQPSATSRAEHNVSFDDIREWPAITTCRTALAVLISRYTRSNDVTFEVLEGLDDESLSATGKLSSYHVHLDPGQTRIDLLRYIEHQNASIWPTEQSEPHSGKSLDDSVNSQTVLAVTSSATPNSDVFVPYTDRALLLGCQANRRSLSVSALYDQSVISSTQISRFLGQLCCLVVQCRSGAAGTLVKDLDAMTQADREDIRRWNADAPPEPEGSILDCISKWFKSSPQHLAVSAWNGDFTYAELDDWSSRLAMHIQSLDLGREHVVPLRFEKSKWTVVAMLATLKAGAAFTLIDKSLPLGRIEAICKQISPRVAFVSASQHKVMHAIVSDCRIVDAEWLQSLPSAERGALPVVRPEDLAYIQFTSGSTGEPKGSMVEHRGMSAFVGAYRQFARMDQSTRFLQFASYAFSGCMPETFGTLMTGGCLCIPSEEDRMNHISAFIEKSNVNFAILIPSFANTIRPEDVPSLKTLIVGGEPMTPETRDTWAGRVRLINACGQSESMWSSWADIEPDTPNVRLIGRGMSTRLWITDPDNVDRLVPVGCPGELIIESCGRARGYLGLTELSASQFLSEAPAWYPQGCEPTISAKLFRSGDMACYQPDGNVVNMGREDSQVKIRGQRVELGEVDFNLRKIVPPEVTAVVEVVKQSGAAQRDVLMAFLVGPLDMDRCGPRNDTEAFMICHDTASHLTSAMETQIGRHAIPSHYVSLKELPRGATGKVDRKRLRAIGTALLEPPKRDTASHSAKPLATSGVEADVAKLWAEAMSIDRGNIGMHDDFFDSGGDSIIAIRMVNKARASGLVLKVEDVLQNPVFADLVAATDRASVGASEHRMILVQARDTDEADLSYAQRGLWFLEQLNPGTPSYHVSVAGRLRGPLQLDALKIALQALEERHETLRTTFCERKGKPVQVIQRCRSADKILQLIDVATGVDYREELYHRQIDAFDLESTPPWRVAVLRLGDEDHVLSIVMHHIISDGWSDDVLRHDLSRLYSAAVAGRDPLEQLEPLHLQYRDFARWQQSPDQDAAQQSQLQYWIEKLADSSPAQLLIDKPRPALPSGRADAVDITIMGSLYESLQKFCRAQKTTSYVVLLAAFRAAHYRLTGAVDATIGTPNAGRVRSELENLVGFFSNTQCMRVALEGANFRELVQQVKTTVTEALAHQDVSFERIVTEILPGSRDASRNPLVQLMFAVHSQPTLGEIHLEGLEGKALAGIHVTRFDAEVHLVQRKDHISGNMLFAKELFEPETIHATVNVFKELLRRGMEEPNVPIDLLRVSDGLQDLESMSLLGTAQLEYPRNKSIVDVFAEQVAKNPTSTAVKDSSTSLTYADLDRQSEVLSTWLLRRSYPNETWIGVLASRTCETIVAFLGILKANMAYVPLDPEAPSTRMEAILSQFPENGFVLLGTEMAAPEIPAARLGFMLVSHIMEEANSERPEHPTARPSATSLAYVMFTSGSTGKPKGVMVEHRGVVRLVKNSNILAELPLAMNVAHLFNIAFDLSVWEIYTAILNGGTVICIDSATKRDTSALEEVFKREQVQAAMLPPVLLKTCLAHSPNILKGLAAFYNGADRFDAHDAATTRKLVPGRVVNAYGPTENSALSTIYDVLADDALTNGVPIGRTVSNSGAYVMDSSQKLVSMGVMGELVVTGDGVARGYTDPSLNKDRFVEVEINKELVRAYRTGDRVRHRPKDGLIEFFGRMDTQVKIRGFRIEMAEVEHAILRQDEVDIAAIVLHQREGQEADLIGFVTTNDDAGHETDEDISDKVESWVQHTDSNFYEGINDIDQSIVGNDFLGWTSMYDGSLIVRSEMQEWLSETIHTLLNGQTAGRVLEIGTGTGMILFNLGDGLEDYIGIDASRPAVNYTSSKIKDMPGLSEKVKVHVGTATELSQINKEQSELVILNSVVQYFPSLEYLLQIVDDIARLPHIKQLFFGDVRSHALNRQFLVSRALHKLGDGASKTQVRQELAGMEEREEELLVSPEFFTSLQSRIPDLIEHVEILPKKMKATNELSSFRYAAVVHFRGSEQVQEVHTVDENDWVDFSARGMDSQALIELLRDSHDASHVAIGNIPYSKTIVEQQIAKALDDAEDSDDDTWLTTAKISAEHCSSLSATDVLALAQSTGFRVEISWARQRSQNGALDAIFHHLEPSTKGSRVQFRFPKDKDEPSSLSSKPLQKLHNVQVERRVRHDLQTQLPSYMIPRRLIVMDEMPLNANGKVDRNVLAKLACSSAVHRTTAARVSPQNQEERALCEEFSHVLGIDIGPEDDFFDLGGHSLMAMRVIPRVSERLGWHILLRDLYQHSTPRALYTAKMTDSSDHDVNDCLHKKSSWPAFMEVPLGDDNSGQESQRATLILVHGFWGQGRIFAGLVPLLNEHLDIIILHDPFFGRVEGPQSLDAWSNFYLEALQAHLPLDSPIIIGGYSFGAFIALRMASLWKGFFTRDLTSVLLLDPAVWAPVNMDELSPEFFKEQVDYALRLFGEDQRDFVMEHFKKFAPLMASPQRDQKPLYDARGLHIASSEVAELGTVEWWAGNYPKLEQQVIDATHHGLFEQLGPLEQVARAINKHWAQIRAREDLDR